MFVLKNVHAPELSGTNCHAKLNYSKRLLKKYSSSDVTTTLLTDEKIFTVVILVNRKKHQLYAATATKKKDVTTKRLRTQSTFRQSLMASVDESQVVEKTRLILSFTESQLLKAVIVTWCCYNSYCSPYVRSRTSSPSFSRTVPGAHGAWGNQLSYP